MPKGKMDGIDWAALQGEGRPSENNEAFRLGLDNDSVMRAFLLLAVGTECFVTAELRSHDKPRRAPPSSLNVSLYADMNATHHNLSLRSFARRSSDMPTPTFDKELLCPDEIKACLVQKQLG